MDLSVAGTNTNIYGRKTSFGVYRGNERFEKGFQDVNFDLARFNRETNDIGFFRKIFKTIRIFCQANMRYWKER